MGALEGKVAIVTGAGSGIGRAISLRFAKEGAKVAAVDYMAATAEETVSMLKAAGGEGMSVACDVSKTADVDRMVTAVADAYGKIDVLCNNAGVFDGFTPTLDTDDALWDRVIGINLKGVFLVARRVIPEMLKNGKGSIVNTASIAGLVANGGGVAYTASKHGVVGVTRQLAAEFSGQGLRINAFCPGGILTGMTKDLAADEATDALIKSGQLMPRWGKPEEMAAAALFLASDESSFSTGSLLVVDGGWTTR
ncbi:MAG: SDR family oxidoreductase [Actinomycetia bacterium]|nr:SDR family oxidoreductase [Actinomycetes bacterium]